MTARPIHSRRPALGPLDSLMSDAFSSALRLPDDTPGGAAGSSVYETPIRPLGEVAAWPDIQVRAHPFAACFHPTAESGQPAPSLPNVVRRLVEPTPDTAPRRAQVRSCPAPDASAHHDGQSAAVSVSRALAFIRPWFIRKSATAPATSSGRRRS